MDYLKSIKIDNILIKLALIFSIYFTTIWINFFYITPTNVDFHKYYAYINYFLGAGKYISFGQGAFYYFLISLAFKQKFNTLDTEFIEIALSFSVQNINLIFYLIGIYGLMRLLKIYNFEEKNILLVLVLVNYLPITIYLRAVMKPEIIGFAFLPWVLYFIEKFFLTNKIGFLYYSVPFIILLINSKASIAAMVIVYLAIFYLKKVIARLDKFDIFKIFISFMISLLIIQFETYRITETNPLSRPYDESYDYQANPGVLFRFNLTEVLKEPFLNYENEKEFYSIHAKSILNITVLDTFGDHFNQYFDFDKSYFKKYRKSLFNDSGPLIDFNSSDRTIIYSGNFSYFFAEELDYIRKILSIIFGLVFYFLIIFFVFFQRGKYLKFLVAPLIGILILYINSLGFPSNNFNPFKGDTFKPFYYSFLFVISFSFLMMFVLKKINKLKYPFVVLFIFSILFIGGHPKENNQFLSEHLVETNSYSLFCNLNNFLFFENNIVKTIHKSGNVNNLKSDCRIEGSFLLNTSTKTIKNVEINCLVRGKVNEEFQSFSVCRDVIVYNTINGTLSEKYFIPYFSLILFVSIFFIILIERKFQSTL